MAEQFGKTKTDITWGITLVLMFRSVGSIAFGIASDRYGRKWPFVVNNLLFIVLELVSRPPESSHFLVINFFSPLLGWSFVVGTYSLTRQRVALTKWRKAAGLARSLGLVTK